MPKGALFGIPPLGPSVNTGCRPVNAFGTTGIGTKHVHLLAGACACVARAYQQRDAMWPVPVGPCLNSPGFGKRARPKFSPVGMVWPVPVGLCQSSPVGACMNLLFSSVLFFCALVPVLSCVSPFPSLLRQKKRKKNGVPLVVVAGAEKKRKTQIIAVVRPLSRAFHGCFS